MVGEVSPCLKVSQNYDANKSDLRKDRHLWMRLKVSLSPLQEEMIQKH